MALDINTLRSIVTVLALLGFLAIVAWAWSGRNKQAFDEAAQLPFADELEPEAEATTRGSGASGRRAISRADETSAKLT